MKNLNTNTIISWGLVIMGVGAVGGWIWISLRTGTSSGTEVPISIISGLTGVLTGKGLAEAKFKREGNIPWNPTKNDEKDYILPKPKHSDAYEQLSDEDKKKVDEMINRVLGSELK
ncbi:MAG: hypothetical protein IKN43_12790 [Selenomonadaceae bacterium]|nr:hypothetical protein [Selenomonadaceae bacterium]